MTITSLKFDTDTCGRCGGSGQMPYAAYNGVCFKCSGHGKVATPAGRSARKLWEELTEAASTRVEAWAVEVGMIVDYGPRNVTKPFTVVAKDFSSTSGSVIDGHVVSAVLVAKNGTSHHVTPDFKMRIRPTSEARREIMEEVARRRKGATLEVSE